MPGMAKTDSGNDDAADQQRDAETDDRDDRHGGVRQRMAHEHLQRA